MEQAYRLLLVLLVPIIPAFVLFKYLPKSKAVAEGPFSGLKIKFSGAVAVYIVLVPVAIFLTSPVPPEPRVQVWTVIGKVLPEGIDLKNSLTIEHAPPLHTGRTNGCFEAVIAVGLQSWGAKFPELTFKSHVSETKRYLANVDLNDTAVVLINEQTKTIELKEPIQLISVSSGLDAEDAATELTPFEPTATNINQ